MSQRPVRPLTTLAMAMGATLLASSVMASETGSNEHDIDITINEIAVLDFNNPAPLAFEIVAPANAGEIPVVQSSDNTRRLYFTSIVSEGDTRSVTVAHDGNVPDGLELRLQAFGPSGFGDMGSAGDGIFGFPTVIDDTGNQVVIAGIGSGYTATGPMDGASLNYSLSISDTPSDLASLVANSGAVTLTYTMGVE